MVEGSLVIAIPKLALFYGLVVTAAGFGTAALVLFAVRRFDRTWGR